MNEQFSVAGTRPGSQLRGMLLIPPGTPRGILQISHGMCEYIGRYQRFMEFMADQGFVVCGHDHLGHGETSDPSDYGYFAPRDGWRILVEDVHRVTAFVKQRFPGIPCFLLGHSMGSFIARLYLSRYSRDLAGAIICGTGGPNPAASLGRYAAALICAVKGPKHPSPLLDRLAFGSFNKRIRPCRTDKDWLTRDEEIVDRYRRDPRCMFTFTASGFRDLSTLSDFCNRRAWYRSLDLALPILLIAGEADPVGSYGRGVRQVLHRLKQQGMADVQMILYPDCRHELLNEVNYQQVQGDILSWISGRLPSSEKV